MDEKKLTAEQLSAISNAIDLYFRPLRERLGLIEQLILEQRGRHEAILLLGTYLDALGTTVLGHKFPSSEVRLGAFLEFYSSFGSRWMQISLPDLYQFIYRARLWINVYSLPMQWRPVERAFLKSLKALGFNMREYDAVDFTRWHEYDAVDEAITNILEKLAGLGPVMPEQNRGSSILEEGKIRSALGPQLSEAFRPVLEKFHVSSILYRNFRCSSVHDLNLPTWFTEGKEFWTEEQPHFVVRRESLALDIDTLALAFPARFLFTTPEECISRVQENLVASKVIPGDIWFDIFLGTELEELVNVDTSTLPWSAGGGDVESST
jgi:hypothetical protein